MPEKDVEMKAVLEENEKDAKTDGRPKITDKVGTNDYDTTLDLLVSGHEKNILSGLQDSGLQFLISGARANVGVKAGRYVFEVRIVEMSPPGGTSGRGKVSPAALVRVGVSKSKSSVILGQSPDSVCFESEGTFLFNGEKTGEAKKFGANDVVAVVVNLDKSSPNKNTLSLFKNGERVSEALPLPEGWADQALFPTVSFRNATVIMNYGTSAGTPSGLWCSLPFTCTPIALAAKADAVSSDVKRPADNKYQVVLLMGLPEEGYFGFADKYLEEHPEFVELSDRSIVKWAKESGCLPLAPAMFGGGLAAAQNNSNDSPHSNFGLSGLDEFSMRSILPFLANQMKRHVLVVELANNMIQETRKAVLANFSAPHFKKTALFVMGEPPASFKQSQQELMKVDKKKVAEAKARLAEAKLKQEQAAKINELTRKRMFEKQKALAEKRQKKMQEMQKKNMEKAQKAAERAKAKAENPDLPDEPEEEEPQEEKKEEEEAEEEKPDEEMEELKKPVVVELDPEDLKLTDEDKKKWFRATSTPDIAPSKLSASFQNFSLADKAEGFDELKFEWAQKSTAEKRLKDWKLEKKVTEKIEDLKPSAYFNDKLATFNKAEKELQKRKKDYQTAVMKKKTAKAQKEAAKKAKEAKKKAEAEAKQKLIETKKKVAEAKKKAKEEAKAKAIAEGKDPPADEPEEEEKVEEEEPPKEEEKEEEEDEPMSEEEEDDDPDQLTVDVWNTDDIHAMNEKGKPLHMKLESEDWDLCQLRFELSLLVHAFKTDVSDPERPGIHESHIGFYYTKYFKKALNLQQYGCKDYRELISMMSNTLYFTEGTVPVLQTDVSDEAELALFVKLTEDARQRRIRAIDLGDESARLKFNRAPVRPITPGVTAVGAYGFGAQPGQQPGVQMVQGLGAVRPMMPGQVGARTALTNPGMMNPKLGMQRPFMPGQQNPMMMGAQRPMMMGARPAGAMQWGGMGGMGAAPQQPRPAGQFGNWGFRG